MRILLLFGLLVLALAVIVLWQDDRAAKQENSAAASGEPRVGRSTLSHGGPGAGGAPDTSGRSLNPLQIAPSDQSPEAARGKE